MNSPKFVLGVTGSIAAYKALDLVRRLKEGGAQVAVVMTRASQELIQPLSFEAVSGNRVYADMFSKQRPAGDGPWRMEHIDLAQTADLVLVAPASANILGKVAAGIADDLLSTVIMATTAPVLFAPAMNDRMWANTVVQGNVARLKALGYRFVSPEAGALACGTIGPGRLAAVEKIVAAAREITGTARPQVLAGRVVLVSTGRTEEAIDPVRVVTNRSSGRMGFALATAARAAGARVILVCGKTSLPAPGDVETIPVTTTQEMLDALAERLPEADLLFMAAAPADFRPKTAARHKLKARALSLELERTPDILTELGKVRHHARLVGFALETDDLLTHAAVKLARKKLDLIVANPAATLDGAEIEATVLSKDGSRRAFPQQSKADFAAALVELAAKSIERRASSVERVAARRRTAHREQRKDRTNG